MPPRGEHRAPRARGRGVPTLIACVAIIISRPEPRRLLLAFYAGGLIVSVTAGILLLAAFKDHGAVIGNTSSDPNPGTSIVAGLVALVLAWLMASDRGRALLSGWRNRHPRRRPKEDGPSWAERRLAGRTRGGVRGRRGDQPARAVLRARARRDRERRLQQRQAFGLILLFNAIMFTLLEVPLVGYLVRPERTAEQVAALRAGSTPTACGSWAG